MIVLPCSMTGLASRLKLSRASLYRAFEALEQENLISRSEKTVSLLDRNRLYPR
jgi:predicted transcriptional regulator